MNEARFYTPVSSVKHAPFQLIRAASALTGFSQKYLREGCRMGSIPHVMCGNRYMVNVPLFLHQLGVPEEGDPGEQE